MTPAEIQIGMATCRIPVHMQDGLFDYLVGGIRPGDFLCSVIAGKLFEAAQFADHINQACLMNYAFFLINYAPAQAIRSEEAITRWCDIGGLTGLLANEG